MKTFYLNHHKKIKYFLVLIIFLLSKTIQSQKFKEMIKDSTDNAIDISGVLNSDLSFLPIPIIIIITEPAVGFGGGLALGYFHKDIKVAGGGGFRYLLARDYGLHAGVDIARGPEQWAWNITIGSHWRR